MLSTILQIVQFLQRLAFEVLFSKPLRRPLRLSKKLALIGPYLCKAELINSGYPKFDAASFVECAGAGNPEKVLLFLDGGIDVNAPGNRNDRALIAAARQGHETIVRLLLNQESVDVNARNDDGESALLEAARRDYQSIVKLLQDNRAAEPELDSKVAQWKLNEAGWSFFGKDFFEAIRKRGTDEVDLFITAGIDLEYRDPDGNTAVIVAAQHPDPALLKVLLKHGAEVNTYNNAGDTALIVAARAGHFKTVEALLDDEHIEVDLRNSKDESAWIAAIRAGSVWIEELFVSRNADSRGVKEAQLLFGFEKRDRFTAQAFVDSCKRGWINVVGDYLTAGMTANACNADGEPALVVAVRRGEQPLVRLFLDQPELDVNAHANGGDTALILAVRDGHEAIVGDLLSHPDIDLDQPGVGGDTVLIVAARLDYETIVSDLLSGHPIKINAANDAAETALLEAARREFGPIVKLLKGHGAKEPDLERKVARWQLEQTGTFTDAELLQRTRVGEVERVRKLLVAGLPADRARDAEGNSALLLAAWSETELLIQALLEFGATINDRNLRGDTALIIAARFGREKTVKLLLKAGADVNARNRSDETALLEAARRKFDAIVELLHKHGAAEPDLERKVARWQLEQERVWSETDFVNAARRGEAPRVEQYLLAGMDVNAAGARDETGLIAAARGNRIEIVKLLIKAGIDLDARDREGVSAVELAWSRRFDEIVDLLTAAGNKWSQKDVAMRRLREAGIHYGSKRFIDAAANGQDANVKLFLDAGMDVNAEDEHGRRVLVEAAKAGQKSVVELLLKNGADTNLRDGFGINALEAARRNELEDVVAVLTAAGAEPAQKATDVLVDAIERADLPQVRNALSASASPDTYTNQSQPVLMEAVLTEQAEIVSDLLASGARANARDASGMTSLMRASELGLVEMMRLLIAAKSPSLNETDPEGRTALILASWKGQVGAVSILIDAGAKQDIEDHNGYTALMTARAKGHERIVELLKGVENTEQSGPAFALLAAATQGEHIRVTELIHQGVAVDGICDEEGNTPLAMTAIRGSTETMKVLIAAGARVDAANRDGDTPLMLAAQAGRVAAVETLLKHEASHALCGATNNHGETALFQAALAGRGSVVQLLAPYTDQPDLGAKGRIPLVEMCFQGDKNAVLALIAADADVNQQQVTLGTSPLMTALVCGHNEIAEILEENGAWAGKDEAQLFLKAKSGDDEGLREMNLEKVELNARNHAGWTALMEGANAGHDGVVKILLDRGADADLQSPDGNETALRLAASRGRSGTLALLIKRTQRRKSSDARALIEAAARGHAEAVRLLVKQAEAPVNGLKGGRIPLIEAATRGHLQAVKVLLDLGADQDRATRLGTTALSAAMLHDHKDVVDLLLQHGSSTQVRDVLLLLAAGKPDLAEVKRLLALSDRPNLDARDEFGRTPLMRACNKGAEKGADAVVAELLRWYDPDKVRAAILDRDFDHNTPLMWAAKAGSPTLVARLLDLKADVYATSKKNRTALMAACRSGNIRTVRILLNALKDDKDRRVAVNEQDEDGNTPLSEALLGASGQYPRDYLQIVSLLERWGANQGREQAELLKAIQKCDLPKVERYIGDVDLNKFRPKGKTPLMLAVESGCLKVTEYLLKKGVELEERGPSDATALILAAGKATIKREDEEIVQLLLKYHADIDWTDKDDRSALLHAVRRGHETIVRALIKEGAKINQRDANGSTALTLAVERRSAGIVQSLLADPGKIDLEVWTGDRRTALTVARLFTDKPGISASELPQRGEPVPEPLLRKFSEIEALLVKAGARAGWDEAELILAIRDGNASRARKLLATASVHTRDLDRNTPLLLACKSNDPSLVRALLKKRASAEVRNIAERTPLIEAAKHGSRELVNELLQKEPDLDLDAQDKQGETALLEAARVGAADVVTLLLEHKANPRVANRSGSTPLIEMSHYPQVSAVQALLDHEANACACTIRHRTAIIEAAAEGHYNILEILLSHLKARLAQQDEKRRIILNAVDDQNCTALDWAQRGVHNDCATLLKKHGGQSRASTPFTVYTSPKGDSFHRHGCPRITESRNKGTLTNRLLRDARREGYEFCLTCQPGQERIDWTC